MRPVLLLAFCNGLFKRCVNFLDAQRSVDVKRFRVFLWSKRTALTLHKRLNALLVNKFLYRRSPATIYILKFDLLTPLTTFTQEKPFD